MLNVFLIISTKQLSIIKMMKKYVSLVCLLLMGCSTVHTTYDRRMPNFQITDKEQAKKEIESYKLEAKGFQHSYSLLVNHADKVYTAPGINPLLEVVSPDSINKLKIANTFRGIQISLLAVSSVALCGNLIDKENPVFFPTFLTTAALSIISGFIGFSYLDSGIDKYNTALENRFQ